MVWQDVLAFLHSTQCLTACPCSSRELVVNTVCFMASRQAHFEIIISRAYQRILKQLAVRHSHMQRLMLVLENKSSSTEACYHISKISVFTELLLSSKNHSLYYPYMFCHRFTVPLLNHTIIFSVNKISR